MIITLTGRPGSGKSTVGKLLAERLHCELFSMGALMDKIALKRGVTLNELIERGKKDDSFHKKVDEYQRALGLKRRSAVFDGWTSFHFIPHSCKVFLDVDAKEAAKRVLARPRQGEEQGSNLDEVRALQHKRFESSRQAYLTHYGLDILDMKRYDIIIDTTDLTPEEVADTILKAKEGKHFDVSNVDKAAKHLKTK